MWSYWNTDVIGNILNTRMTLTSIELRASQVVLVVKNPPANAGEMSLGFNPHVTSARYKWKLNKSSALGVFECAYWMPFDIDW